MEGDYLVLLTKGWIVIRVMMHNVVRRLTTENRSLEVANGIAFDQPEEILRRLVVLVYLAVSIMNLVQTRLIGRRPPRKNGDNNRMGIHSRRCLAN